MKSRGSAILSGALGGARLSFCLFCALLFFMPAIAQAHGGHHERPTQADTETIAHPPVETQRTRDPAENIARSTKAAATESGCPGGGGRCCCKDAGVIAPVSPIAIAPPLCLFGEPPRTSAVLAPLLYASAALPFRLIHSIGPRAPPLVF